MNNSESSFSGYGQPMFQEDESIDLKRFVSLFISNWYWFAIFLFVSFTIAYGINRYSEDLFSVTSSLLIKDETLGGYSGMAPIFPGKEIYKNQQNLKNEIGILRSFALNRQVIDSLPEFQTEYILIGRRNITEHRKYKDSPFVIKFNEMSGNRPGFTFVIIIKDKINYTIAIKGFDETELKRKFGDTISSRDFKIPDGNRFKFVVDLRNSAGFNYEGSLSNKYNFRFLDPDLVANEYLGKLQVTPIDEEASLVRLSTQGHVPLQEIDYLNKLMELYINKGLSEKNQASTQTVEFINTQLDVILDSLRLAEDSLQKFRLKNRLIDITDEGSSIRTRLEKFETEKFSFELQKKYFDYLIGYLSSRNQTGDIVSPSIMDVNDPVLERLITELSSLQLQRSQLGLNLATSMPAFDLIDARITVIKESLKENIENSLQNITLSINDVEDQIRSVEGELSKFPNTEKGLVRIQRKFDLNNTVYNYLLEKRAEAQITKASNVPDNKKVDNAGFNNIVQVKPRKSRNNMMAVIFGLVFPMILILVIDYLNNKVIDRKDVERITSAPVLGFISHNEHNTETPVLSKPSSTLAESFRSVRTALNFFITDIPNPVISITSTVSSEGKTFISINLAIIMASLGKKVLLIGLDLRKPKIHKVLDIDNSNGMSRYLSGESAFEEVVFDTKVKNMSYATSGPVPPNPAELIDSDRMREFLAEAKKRYDYIIIDTPPVAIVTDALLVARYSDMNIFVVRQRYTSKNTLSLIQEFYQSKKMKNLSIIINDISLSGYYGYGLRYGYTMRYGGYAYGYNFYGDYVSAKYGYGKNNESYYTSDSEE